MRIRTHKTGVWFLLGASVLLGMAGCKRVKPQAPANVQEDSMLVATQLMNMQLADAAQTTVTRWVQQQDTAFTEEEYGYWYCFIKRTEGAPIAAKMRVEIFYSTYLLSGEMIEDRQATITVGKRETLWAIDEMLLMMHEGEKVVIASPYYTAYGREGNSDVPPLTNCIIHINEVRIIESGI